MITIYGLRNCDVCRKAMKWLAAEGIEATMHDFRKDGLDELLLAQWLDICDWQVLNAVNEENLEALLKVLRVFFDSMGPERIVWGTDLPMVGSEAVNNTLTWSDIARNLPEWGSKYNITFTDEERDGLCEGAGKAVLSNFDFNFLD